MKKESLFFLTLLVIFLGSCSTADYLKTSDSHLGKLERTDASKIEVYSLSEIGKKYSVLGEVLAASDAGEKSASVVILLKDQAANMGADAIVDLKFQFVPGFWSIGLLANGTAVKFANDTLTK